MGEQLRPRFRGVWELLFERLRNPGMQLLALRLEQRLVGRVLDQGVLEAVGRLGWDAAAEYQLGCDQLIEGGLQFRVRAVGHRSEQRMGELAADRGADLRDLLDRGEAVEAGEQRVVERRGDRECRQGTIESVVVPGVSQKARLEHRLGQLLDE
jgi:hypothetical protein